jgi:uncharacterized protein (TIGR00304 family)
MNKYHFLSLVFLASAVVSFTIGFLEGDIEVGIFFIFPFVIGSSIFLLIGILLIFLAVIFYMFGFARFDFADREKIASSDEILEKKSRIKGGGVILIGPIPIVFGSSWKISLFLMILGIIIIVFLLLLFRINYF